MSNSLHRAVVLGAALALAACASACGGNGSSDLPAPPVAVAELKQGTTLFKTNGMVTGAYRKGERAIFFETRRGAPINDVYKAAFPHLGDFEMDVLVLDTEGRVVYVQQGGDTLDPKWEKAMIREHELPRVDPIRRAEDFALMKEWAMEFEKAELPAELALEKTALVHAQLSVRPNMLKPAVERQIKEVGYTPTTNQIEIHDQCIFLCAGRHSAHWSNNDGYVINACNHGDCASSMGEKCQISGTATSYGGSNCGTAYNWSSNGNHNCHDDTIRAVWGLRYGAQGSNTSGVCNNGSSHYFSPSCTDTSW